MASAEVRRDDNELMEIPPLVPTSELENADDKVIEAVELFEEKHRVLARTAEKVAASMQIGHRREPSICFRKEYPLSVRAVKWNRLFVAEEYDPFAPAIEYNYKPHVRVRRPRQKWHLDGSVWAPRKRNGNSKSYWETKSAMRAVYDADWELARQGHGLEKMIVKCDDDKEWRDSDGNGTHDEVDEVREALWAYAFEIYGAFDYYAVLFSEVENAAGEPDVFNMSFNAYLEFVRQTHLPTKQLKPRDFEVIWVLVNTEERLTKDIDTYNKARHLNRQEFLQVLVHVAVGRFLRGSKGAGEDGCASTDVSEAIEYMCVHHLRGLLPPIALHDANSFRDKYCYNVFTDTVLKKHLVSLRNLYELYCGASSHPSDTLASGSLMSVGEWIAFVEDIGLIASSQVSLFDAKMIFMWARIRGCADYSKKSFIRMRHLFFEDFLEALVRLAAVCALPTDEDIATSGATDAGEYLMTLQETDEHAYKQFLKERKGRWDREPRQRIWRCVDHLVALVAHTVESNVTIKKHCGEVEEADGSISVAEARQFMQRRRSGAELKRRASENMSSDFVKAMEIVKQKLEACLRQVPIFSALSPQQLGVLRDAMVEAPFDDDDYIFEQDDEGDVFYVIISGEVRVVREDPATGEETVLCELGEGSYFGERSLLKGEKRFASIQANTQLQTMCINKTDFEKVLGPLADLVPDQY